MRYLEVFSILILFVISIIFPTTSFAENSTDCTFGGKSTLPDDIFEKDFAVKAFVEKHPDASKSIPTDEFGSAKNQLVLQAQKDNTEERLEIRFHTDANGCHIPASYHYSYDDGIIDVTVRNSIANFTEIMNLIESDDLGIEDFYPDDCTFVDLDVTMSNGKSYGICKEGSAVTILVDAVDDGSLQVDLPIEMVYSLPSSDCVPTGDFFVMMDKEETYYEITPTETGNLVTVEFPEGFHKIRILGSVIIPNPSPAQYCGIVEGYLDKKYLAPLDQTDHGVASKSIRCNDGLTLVQKYDNTPACVRSETKEKLEQRGWAYHKETLLILDNNQQDIGRYLKQVSILDESSIDATLSYPTNTAHHKMFPDEYQSIVSDCTEKNNGANLSLLYLREIDNDQNKMTFKVEDREFDGLQCDDALWQELTRWGYCGPPSPLIFRPDSIASSISDAQKKADFVLDVPKYLPEGYAIQKIAVESDGKSAILYASQSTITNEMNSCEFTWRDKGIFLQYSQPSESHDTPSGYLNVSDSRRQKVAINNDTGYAVERWVGDRFGMPIPQQSKILFYMQDENVIIQIRSSLTADELVRIAESISDPIFNSEIIPDYAHHTIFENDNLISVQITGDAASQICNKIRMICEDDHTFDAEYDLSTQTATFEQSVSYNRYVLEIMPGEICYKINGDPKNYCSTLHVSYSPIVDGNKSALLFKPLDYWKNMSQEELYKINEKYGETFYKELGKMVLKDEIKNELKRQNIENTNDDFTLHVAGVDESSQVFYKSVINGTDGKSYMFDGGAYYNQIRGLSFEELIFHDNILDELPLDSLFDDQPIIIFPKDDDDYNPHDTITVNLEDGNDMIFYNGMSVPMKISVYSSEKTQDQPEPEWTSPILDPAQTMTFSLDGTGIYKWDGRLEPEPSTNDWWPRYAGGTIAAYSNETQSLKLEEKLRIAQVFIQNSEIPYSGLSTKNNILKIGFNSAIHEMLPDAREYYAARAYQLVPFDVSIMVEDPDWNY